MIITVVAILVTLGTVAYLGYPIVRRDRSYAPDQLDGFALAAELRAEKDSLLQAIKDLEFDLASGKLSHADYSAMRSKYELRAMAVLEKLDAQEAALQQQILAPARPTPSVANAVKAAGQLWSRPLFAASVIGLLLAIVGGGGFLLGRVTQDGLQQGTAAETAQGSGGQMVAALESRLAQNPRDLEALVGLGRVYLQSGQMPKAIELYKRALEVDSNNVSALSGLAMILSQAGHSDQALMLFDRALAINPQVPMALLFKGRILYEERKDYAGAIENWEQFLRLMPQGGPAEVVRGWIDEARREARKMEGEGPTTKIP
ncbi:MAG TPA: tetratricopeptide repeat protein [Candidatus Tectomicrobia bacterium]|nr:tetratricopeptide repeat protein [Candidatus Tectomicrobia bacterium]